MKFRTRAIHVGNSPCEVTGAVVRPIYLSSTFRQPGAGDWGPFDYSRSGNPTRSCFEESIAALENGCGAMAFASGMAATHCAIGMLSQGDHVVAGKDIYGGTYRLLHKIVNRFGILISQVDCSDLQALEAAITPATKILWIETPGNPLMSLVDIKACANLAHAHGCLLAVDSTFATPVLTRPLELGADIVMHSATKYIGGHSDLMGGVLVVKDSELYDQLYFVANATGAILAPLESYLCSRGLKTMELRVHEQCRTALKIAKWLEADSRVKRVLYPGLSTHPGHALAKSQMQGGFGAMVSFELKGNFAQTKKFVESTTLFHLAVSLGAVESLIEQPAAMSHASYDKADRLKHGITDELIRLSIGLEDTEDLQHDLDQAFKIALA